MARSDLIAEHFFIMRKTDTQQEQRTERDKSQSLKTTPK